MISLLLFDRNGKESKRIELEAKDVVALLSDEDLVFAGCGNREQVKKLLETHDFFDLACVDVVDEDGIKTAEKVRGKYPEVRMMLIVTREQSPLSYIRPGIIVSSLLIRPASESHLKESLSDFIGTFLARRNADTEKAFLIEEKEGTTKIPFSAIYYFEARSKKVYVRSENEEYGFYGTLDDLENRLPDSFMRCHRGFIVNAGKIKQFRGGENLVVMGRDIEVPISRSYRAKIKEVIHA